MKRKRKILWIVVTRFIGYSLGAEFVVGLLETVFSFLIWGPGVDFPDGNVLPLLAFMNGGQIALLGLFGLLSVAVSFTGVLLFARSISRKVSEPARRMVEGFSQVSSGKIDVTLDFETETEFREMRDAFNVMARRLKESEEQRLLLENERMQLFSHIAHDLKTPMTTISSYTRALESGMVEGAEKQREYHLAIKAKSAQMNGLIDELLAYSKMSSPGYHINRVRTDAAELLRVACASVFGEIESKRMELEIGLPDVPVFCDADPLELNRAIGNLLSNAVRHNPEGSLIRAGLTEEADAIAIEIADSGPKISPAIAGKLFEPFVSGSDSRNSGSGNGLGLAIVKKVAEQHAGKVFVSKAPAPYTKMFVFKIPKIPIQK